MTYLLVFALLFISVNVYFKIALKRNIVDVPNKRSSHQTITIRGGGVVYWFASFLLFINNYSEKTLLFFTGITIIALISFIDDLINLRQSIRLLFHTIAICFAFLYSGLFEIAPVWSIVISIVLFIGIINAYNFMDGINGITGLYSIVVLASLQYVNIKYYHYIYLDAIWFPMIASIVFLFFNFRKNAKCFAGDVGSITIAFWIVSLLILLIIKSGTLIWIGFLCVYGVDTVMTIIHRIWLRQNILEAHRLHFYQVLVNEKKYTHLFVSSLYSLLQLISSFLIIQLYPFIKYWILIFILIILITIYLIKFKLIYLSSNEL